MARRPSIDDQDILRAAREVFLARGVNATTVEVATRAGISEASVFKRFGTKDALFAAAMRSDLALPEALAGLGAQVGRQTPSTNLETVGLALLDHVRVRMPLTMMSWSSRGQFTTDDDNSPERFIHQLIELLATYIEGEIGIKRLRRVNPQIFARAFIGGISNFVISQLFNPGGPSIAPATFVSGLVGLLIDGCHPQLGRA